tara:strand:- start:16 stop:306 length:291 start_codon:yes stop_codon:yes gene_type:complete
MDTKIMRKLKQLYVDDETHTNINGLAILKEQPIKTVVTNFIKAGFKTDLFFNYCQEMHKTHVDEARRNQEDPKSFDYYCEVNLDWLKEGHHKSLLD